MAKYAIAGRALQTWGRRMRHCSPADFAAAAITGGGGGSGHDGYPIFCAAQARRSGQRICGRRQCGAHHGRRHRSSGADARRQRAACLIVDIKKIAEMTAIEETADGGFRVGAAAPGALLACWR